MQELDRSDTVICSWVCFYLYHYLACVRIYIPGGCWYQPKIPAALPKLISIVQILGNLVGRSTRDEEPLVNAWVYGGRSEVLALGEVELVGINTIGRVGDRDVGAVEYVRFCQ